MPRKPQEQRLVDLETKLGALEELLGQLQQNDLNTAQMMKQMYQHLLGQKAAIAAVPPLVSEEEKAAIIGELPQTGKSSGVPAPEDPVDESLDTFLFEIAPQMLAAISQGDVMTAAKVTDWLLKEESAKDFFLLWFASAESVRQTLLLTIVLRQLQISDARFGVLQNSISQEGLNEVREQYKAIVEQAQQGPAE